MFLFETLKFIVKQVKRYLVFLCFCIGCQENFGIRNHNSLDSKAVTDIAAGVTRGS